NGAGPKGLWCSSLGMRPTRKGRSRVNKAKPFDIPRKAVWEAFRHVKANQGAAGTNRKREHPVICFDFLGYQFRPRKAKWRANLYGTSFLPGASQKALKAIRQGIQRWSLQTRSDKALDDLARMFNPYIRGWINYYGHFYKSALYTTIPRIDAYLTRWV